MRQNGKSVIVKRQFGFQTSPEHISTSKNLLPFNNVKFISFEAL